VVSVEAETVAMVDAMDSVDMMDMVDMYRMNLPDVHHVHAVHPCPSRPPGHLTPLLDFRCRTIHKTSEYHIRNDGQGNGYGRCFQWVNPPPDDQLKNRVYAESHQEEASYVTPASLQEIGPVVRQCEE
jgi:hypothetical protein